MKFIKSPYFFLGIITLVLAIIPFFWLNPGQIDLGGDSTRLYFYQPIEYFKSTLLYVNLQVGFGGEENYFSFLPFVGLLAIISYIVKSPYLLITLFNSFQLVIAFLAVFGIAREMLRWNSLKDESTQLFSSLFAGVFYVFSPLFIYSAWDRALISHNQIFLNPLMFFLILKFFNTNKFIYLLLALLTSFLFAPNYGYGGAPTFFAFYPIALLFIFFYHRLIRKNRIDYRKIISSSLLFFGLHAFHIVPTLLALFNQSGNAYIRAFTDEGKFNIGLNYFLSASTDVFLYKNLLGIPQYHKILPIIDYFFIVFPLIIIGSFILLGTSKLFDKRLKKSYLLLGTFFIVILFLDTAKITPLGFEIYKNFFNIPGFSMFRNYYGQWMFLYLFFFTLLFSTGFYIFITSMKNNLFRLSLTLLFIAILLIRALPFLQGDMINIIANRGEEREFSYSITMDPEFSNLLTFIRNLNQDGKFITFPMTESYIHNLKGTNNAIYQGPSPITHLTGRSDFSGYQLLIPFTESFLPLVKNGDTKAIIDFLALLNVRYIYYNSDPQIMEYFSRYPYQYIKDFMPADQKGYQDLLKKLPFDHKVTIGGKYHIFEVKEEFYLPHVYIASRIQNYNKVYKYGHFTEAFYKNMGDDKRVAFLEKDNSYLNQKISIPKIEVQRINPTKYYIQIKQASDPYFLVLSEKFNRNWKIYSSQSALPFDGLSTSYSAEQVKEYNAKNVWLDSRTFETSFLPSLNSSQHFEVNGYANGWMIYPSKTGKKNDYYLILEMDSQKYYYISLLISAITFIISIFLLIKTIQYKKLL